MARVAPYGSWRSPITAEWLARRSTYLMEPRLDGNVVWWIELRPAESGRSVVVRANPDGSGRADAIPKDHSARTRVHEYGGGAYAVQHGIVFYSNDADGRVYRDGDPITPEPPKPRALRYADFEISPDGGTVYCVREAHREDREPVNEIVAISAAGDGEPEVVATGHDFYAAPRLSPDGGRLAWVAWDHPRMPWDGTELYVDGERVAGGPSESIVSPSWSPDGILHWVSDQTGWWNLYRDGNALHPAEAEFGAPLWVFGETTFAFLDDGRIACVWTKDGFGHLGLIDPETGALDEVDAPYTPNMRAPYLASDGQLLAYIGGSPTRTAAVVVLDPATTELTVVARGTRDEPDERYVSVAEPLEYQSAGGRPAHALFYRPRNADFEGPEGEQPPLIVITHGGPTAQNTPELDLTRQFWTSRGFAVVDVNYGGSTGYGRPYRELLRGQWGVVDLEDCTEAALHLARIGEADTERLAIRGGSAGGYTTLCALAFTDVFHAGASYYGVADIRILFDETHKFESRYGDALVPPDKMAERSPINAVDQITAAVIIFQGLEDMVVPTDQAEMIVEALDRRDVMHEYHAYEGEGHGFRKAESIVDSFESELRFYGKAFGFEPDV